jgi:hypothetical protein
MFTLSEMVPLDDDLLFEIRADRFNFGYVVPPNFLVLYFWVQSGRKTGPLEVQNGVWLVSKGSRINRNFAESWSGRWESNPRPKLGKLEIKL